MIWCHSPCEDHGIQLGPCRINAISGSEVAGCAVVMHQYFGLAVMVEIVREQLVPSYRALCFEPRLRHTLRTAGEHALHDGLIGHMKSSHGSRQSEERECHCYQHFRKGSPSRRTEAGGKCHEITTRPVRLTVTVVRRCSRS